MMIISVNAVPASQWRSLDALLIQSWPAFRYGTIAR
jgi:hypothetical protein